MSSDLKLLELQLRNIGSYGNQLTTIDLSNPGSTLIIGVNLDSQNSAGNGCGKSFLLQTICYALYNKPLQNISLNKLINASNSSRNVLMEVRLTFSKGDDVYSIYRCRGESFNIVLSKNGVDMTFASVADNDAALVEILGMSYEIFTKVIIFSGKSVPFLELPVAQQRAQIEELFSITLLSEKAVKLKKLIKDTEDKILVQTAIIKERDSQVEAYNRHLLEAKNRISKWESDREEKLLQLAEELEFLKEVDFEQEKELHSLVADIQKQASSISSQLSLATKDRDAVFLEVKKLTKELNHLSSEKCPYCLQKFAGALDKIDKKTQLLEQDTLRLAELDEAISKKQAELDAMKVNISSAKELMSFSSLSEVVRAEANAGHQQEQIDNLIAAENPHIEAYDALIANPINKAATQELDLYKKELEHQQFLLKLLTDKSSFIRRKIISRTIPFLNGRLIHYTKELGLPHIVKFDDDMSCSVSEMGRELDFGNLSGGEAKRVNLSFSLAFRDVLHQLHSRVNCLFIDEIDGSLDATGVEAAFRLLKQKTRDDNLGMWIISHRPEAIGRFDRTVKIVKQLGFSRIEE